MRPLLHHLRSPAMLVALLALCAAIGGGAYAASTLPANSVGTKQLRNGAVTAGKVQKGTLLASNFKTGQLALTPRDLGTVFPGRRAQFRHEELIGWQAVTHTGPGAYCLTPDASSTATNSVIMLSVGSAGSSNWGIAFWDGDCTVKPLAFRVVTLDASGTRPLDDVAFTAMVP